MKYSGYYLTFTGVIHSLIGLMMGWPVLIEMHNAGWFASTIVEGQMMFDRSAITWFILAGLFWVLFGMTLQSAISQGFNPPKSLGWGFVIIGAVIAFIMPVSGAYLFIVQGIILLIGHSRFASKSLAVA